jgi:hypothetical protein
MSSERAPKYIESSIEPAIGEEREELLARASELFLHPLTGESFNEFVDIAIKLVGGKSSTNGITTSYWKADKNLACSIQFERIRKGRRDYAIIKVKAGNFAGDPQKMAESLKAAKMPRITHLVGFGTYSDYCDDITSKAIPFRQVVFEFPAKFAEYREYGEFIVTDYGARFPRIATSKETFSLSQLHLETRRIAENFLS